MKLVTSGTFRNAPPELQKMWADHFTAWVKFFKKHGAGVARVGTKRRLKIQELARAEIARTILHFKAGALSEYPPACQKGCAHCCYQIVDINSLEAARLAEITRQMPDDQREDVIQRLQSADKAWQQAGEEPTRFRHPCPFLAGNACLVYEDRPLNCRSHVSVDAAFCLTEMTTTKAVLSSDVPEIKPGAIAWNSMWRVLLHSITLAANELIGRAGPLPAAVLKRLATANQ